MAIGFTNNYFKNEDFTGACDEKRKKKMRFCAFRSVRHTQQYETKKIRN